MKFPDKIAISGGQMGGLDKIINFGHRPDFCWTKRADFQKIPSGLATYKWASYQSQHPDVA